MNQITYLISICFIADIVFTYLNVVRYKKLFPNKDYTNLELNPLVKTFWKLCGLLYGGIIATLIQIFLIVIFIISFSIETLYTLFGVYIAILLIHLDNYSLINKKIKEKNKKPKKKERKWRKFIIVLLIVISFLDLASTFYYINSYSEWRPDVPYNQMEANPLLLLLWNNFGLLTGTILGAFIIWILLYIVGKKAHWLIILIVLLALSFGVVNNINHIGMLNKLIELYPTGII